MVDELEQVSVHLRAAAQSLSSGEDICVHLEDASAILESLLEQANDVPSFSPAVAIEQSPRARAAAAA